MQFDPSIYERINERKQNAEQQNSQNLADSISSIPKSLMAYVQQQNEQKQQGVTNRRNTLMDAISVQNAGGDPTQVASYESGIPLPQKNSGMTDSPESAQSPLQNMGGKPQNPMMPQGQNPMAAMGAGAPQPQSPGPWSNPQPQGTPAATTGGAYSSPPTPMLAQQNGSQGGQASSGRGVLDHWDQQNPHLSSAQTLGQQPGQGQLASAGVSDSPQQPGSLSSIFPKQGNADYGQIIDGMAKGDYSGFQKLTPKQQALVQADPRYKQLVKPQDQETVTPVDAVAAMLKLDPQHASALKKQFPNGMTDKQIGYTSGGIRMEQTMGTKQDQQDQKRLKQLGDDLDPSRMRSGPFGVSKQVFDRAERLQTLASAVQNGNYDRRQVEELAIGLNAMLSGSNTGAQQQVAALVPQTALGNAAKLTEWLTSEPTGTNQQAFVQRMMGSVDREKQTALNQMNRTRFSRIAKYSDLESNPQFEGILRSNEVDPEEYKNWKTNGYKSISAVPSTPGQSQGLMWQGKPIKDTPANRAWLAAQQGGQQ